MYNKASVGSGGSRVVAKSASTAFKNKGNNFSVLNQSLIALRGQLFVPDRCLKALELDTALGLIKRNFKNITGPSDERPAASAAPFAIIRVGRWGSVSLVYPAVVSSPPLFLLLLRVLAQQGPHLILVIKWTGTESGLQPSSVLRKPTDKRVRCQKCLSSILISLKVHKVETQFTICRTQAML